MSSNQWFKYSIKAQPHQTDYAGVVWHGSYINWMEEARIQYFTTKGIEYKDLIDLGCHLPVIEMSVRYHKPMKLGTLAMVKSRINNYRGVRMEWEQNILCPQEKDMYVTGQITLVAVDVEKGKILRRIPTILKNTLLEVTNN